MIYHVNILWTDVYMIAAESRWLNADIMICLEPYLEIPFTSSLSLMCTMQAG